MCRDVRLISTHICSPLYIASYLKKAGGDEGSHPQSRHHSHVTQQHDDARLRLIFVFKTFNYSEMAKSKQQSSNNNLTPARRAVVAHLVMALLLLYCQSIPSGYCFYWPAAGRGLVNGGAGGIRVDPFLKSIHLFNDLTMMTRVAPYYSTTTTISAIDHHQQRQRQRQLSYSKNVYINKTTSHTTVTVSS